MLRLAIKPFKIPGELREDTAMLRNFLGLVLVCSNGVMLAMPASAADYPVRPRAEYATIDRGPNPYCGPRCGCPTVTFVRHKELRQFYASTFDPRDKDEPQYTYGAVRTYARFEKQIEPSY
jgi:hypothetical protein